MELIDRYLQAVKFALPKAQQDDIIKELSDNILSRRKRPRLGVRCTRLSRWRC